MIRPKCARCGEVFQGYGTLCEKCADVEPIPSRDNGTLASRDKAPVNKVSRDNNFPDLAARLDALEARFDELKACIEKRRTVDRERQRRKRAGGKS